MADDPTERRPSPGGGEGPGERPPLPVEEMGGDPACWAGLVEDVRDAPVTEAEGEGPDRPWRGPGP